MATALMAIARKVIILDVKETEPPYLYGLGAIVLAMSIGYWLVVVSPLQTYGGHERRERIDRRGKRSDVREVKKRGE